MGLKEVRVKLSGGWNPLLILKRLSVGLYRLWESTRKLIYSKKVCLDLTREEPHGRRISPEKTTLSLQGVIYYLLQNVVLLTTLYERNEVPLVKYEETS